MSSKVKAIPDGFHTVNVYLVLPSSDEALKFYSKAFGAEEVMRMSGPGGQGVMHAEMKIGDCSVMLTDENEEWGMKSALKLGGSPISLHIYVEDCDAAFKRAIEAGCTEIMPVTDMFWGDRYGKLKDPYGFEWGIGTHVEDVSPEEMAKRQQEWFAQMAAGAGEACEG